MLPALVSPKELAALTGIPVGTWASWRSQRRGPSYIKAGSRVLYPKESVLDWLETGLVETEREGGSE